MSLNMQFFNLNIERAILSALLFSPEQFDYLERLPKSTAFYNPDHKAIYEAMLKLRENEKPIDEEYVKTYLERIGKFDEVAMLDLMSANPITNIKAYIDDLEDMERKRKLNVLSLEIRRELEEERDSRDILEFVDSKLFDISQSEDSRMLVDIASAIHDATAHIDKMRKNPNTLIGFDTGFEKLNELTGGFMPGDLVIIASRPAVGKSALAAKIMLSSSKSGNGTALLSLEMPKEQISLRMMSMESGVPLQQLRSGKINDEEYERVKSAGVRISSLDMHIDDSPIVYLRTLRSKIRRMVTRNSNIKIVIIDYLQLIENSSKKDRYLQVGDVSRSLKVIAKELNIAIVALSQVNRDPESRANKRPLLSDLRESGSLEQDADLIMFLYNDEIYKKLAEDEKAASLREKGVDYRSKFKMNPISITELIIGKQRNGPTDTVLLDFHKSTTMLNERP